MPVFPFELAKKSRRQVDTQFTVIARLDRAIQ
jgi:hypothetical protein